MPDRRAILSRLLVAALLVAVVLLLVGCGSGDQNTFAAEGDVARKQRDLLIFWVLGPAAIIFVLVQGVLIYAVIRFRRRKGQGLPEQVHGNTRLEIAWTIAPAILLLIIAVPTVDAIFDLGRDPDPDALLVRVTGRQWAWEFEYLDDDYVTSGSNPSCVAAGLREPRAEEGQPLCVVDELHIPVGRQIAIELEAFDVNHSFWVPRLAGKLDAIPGRTNRMWFNATSPSSNTGFTGQCAEFCGLGHADMKLIIFAVSEEEFEAWIADQLEGAASASAGSIEPELASHGE